MSPDALSSPVPAIVRGLLLAATLATAAFVASTVVPALRGGAGPNVVWDTGVYLVIFALAIAVCAARAVHSRPERWSWAVLALALSCTWIGDLIYVVHLNKLEEIPYPSVADAFYLAFYPLAYGAVGGILRSRVPRVHGGMWLDGLVSGLAVGAGVAALAFDRIVADTGGDPVAVLTTLAYPIGDLLLLVIVVGVVGVTGGRPGRTWLLFGAGLAVWCVTDTTYLAQAAAGTYAEGSLLDAGWPIGALMLATASWLRPTRATRRAGDWTTLVIPSLSTLLAAGVLVICALGNGRTVAISLAGGAVASAVSRTFLTFRDVRRLAESRRQALTDDLTGLPNRRALMEELHEIVAADTRVALLLIDLDHFKELNDTLGHHVGDRLLIDAGERMSGVLRPGDLLARLGGDEFAGVLRGDAQVSAARDVAARVRQALEAPFVLDGIPVQVDGSVGVAVRPDHAATAAELLQFADVAMYQAKADRSGVEVYTAERDGHSRDRLALVGQLREAIERGELAVHLQPQVVLRTDRLVAVEALVRWEHPERGLLGPGEFLPAVEQTNVMRPLTERVLRDTLAIAAGWREAGEPVPIAVNVAAPNLLDLDFPATIARLLGESGAQPQDLHLEITENSVMVDPDRASAVLAEIQALGVRLSLDDFGTGHSSLARLRHLPVDELKIDRSFVLGMEADQQDAAIVRAAATLGRELGLTVVAEGVETPTAWAAVRSAGCDVAQGYLVSRPLPPDDFARWRRGWDARGGPERAAA